MEVFLEDLIFEFNREGWEVEYEEGKIWMGKNWLW